MYLVFIITLNKLIHKQREFTLYCLSYVSAWGVSSTLILRSDCEELVYTRDVFFTQKII